MTKIGEFLPVFYFKKMRSLYEKEKITPCKQQETKNNCAVVLK